MTKSMQFNITSIISSVLLLTFVLGAEAQVPSAKGVSFESLRAARSVGRETASASLTPVRESILRDAALTLGSQWGLGDRSRELIKMLDEAQPQLDRRYEFGALMMGVGYLPPVISEARDAVAIEGTTMRVAKAIYVIDEPPRPVRVAPTWRDWLYVGLDPELRPAVPMYDSVLPKDAVESRYWDAQLQMAYAQGREQANQIFDLNMARLQRTYVGMRRYYDLYKRGMVSAPTITSASSVANVKDPNTLIVGDTVFSVLVSPSFSENTSTWVPLGQ